MLKYFSNGENPFGEKLTFSEFVERKAASVYHKYVSFIKKKIGKRGQNF